MAVDIASALKWIGDAPITVFKPDDVLNAERAIKTLQQFVATQKLLETTPETTPKTTPAPETNPVQKLADSLNNKIEIISAFLNTAAVEAIQGSPSAQKEEPRVRHSTTIEGVEDPSSQKLILRYFAEDSLRREFEVTRGKSIEEKEEKPPRKQSPVKRYVDSNPRFSEDEKASAARAINNGIKVRIFELIAERKLFQNDQFEMRPALASTLGMIVSLLPKRFVKDDQLEPLVDAIGLYPNILSLARQKHNWRQECLIIYKDGYNHVPPYPTLAFQNDGRVGYPPFHFQVNGNGTNLGGLTSVAFTTDTSWSRPNHYPMEDILNPSAPIPDAGNVPTARIEGPYFMDWLV